MKLNKTEKMTIEEKKVLAILNQWKWRKINYVFFGITLTLGIIAATITLSGFKGRYPLLGPFIIALSIELFLLTIHRNRYDLLLIKLSKHKLDNTVKHYCKSDFEINSIDLRTIDALSAQFKRYNLLKVVGACLILIGISATIMILSFVSNYFLIGIIIILSGVTIIVMNIVNKRFFPIVEKLITTSIGNHTEKSTVSGLDGLLPK